MAEQYFFVRTILMYVGAGLVLLLLIGAGICELAHRVRIFRHRQKLSKALKSRK